MLKSKNEDKVVKYSKRDFLDFCQNVVYGFDLSESIHGIDGISKRFDNWVKFKNK